MPGGSLPRRETEMVILRVAYLRDSTYELEQHKRLGRRAGLTDQEIERVQKGPSVEGWTPRERVLLEVTEELIRTQDVSHATWRNLGQHLDNQRIIELVMLVCHYDMLATFIRTLRIDPDA